MQLLSIILSTATLLAAGAEAYNNWAPHYGGQWCYEKAPIPMPRPPPPSACCRLPQNFGANVVGLTCVPGTLLRPGESCYVACTNNCAGNGGSFAYTCDNGVLEKPSLACYAPPPPPPKPANPACYGPRGEVMAAGYTYSLAPWGNCVGNCKTMFAWCDPQHPGKFLYCCGAFCQLMSVPKYAPYPVYSPQSNRVYRDAEAKEDIVEAEEEAEWIIE